MKHTKTPWDLESRPMELFYRIGRKAKGIGISYCYDEQDAEFIVRACNAHDDLVKALQAIRDLDHSTPMKQSLIAEMKLIAGTALAKANG